MVMGKRYSKEEKKLIQEMAKKVKSRQHLEMVIAPALATQLNRSLGAVIKQVEIVLGKHFRDEF